jgi:hypothetical protein
MGSSLRLRFRFGVVNACVASFVVLCATCSHYGIDEGALHQIHINTKS